MNKNLQNYFTTGEFAKLCGINKRTLFHYHDIGLFCPAITDKNGYRYYSYRQLDTFLIISMLKELRVPLKEMKTYLDERTPQRLLNLSKQKIIEVNSEIKKLNQIKHLLEETVAYIHKGLHANFEDILVEEQEEEYLMRSALLNEENTKDYIKWMLEFTRFENNTQSKDTSFVGTMLSKNNIINGNYNCNSYFFAKSSNKAHANAVKPKGLYAVAYHHGSYDTISKTYERLIKFFAESHLHMGEFAYEKSLLDDVALKNEDDYVMQITIAIENM